MRCESASLSRHGSRPQVRTAPSVGAQQAQDHAQGRGLARAVGADEAEHLAALDRRSVTSLGGHDVAVAAGHAGRADHAGRRRSALTARPPTGARRASAGMPGLKRPSALSRPTLTLIDELHPLVAGLDVLGRELGLARR